jgi:hypothetical protein
MTAKEYWDNVKKTTRSPTVGVNVVVKRDRYYGGPAKTYINIFVDGRPDNTVEVPGEMSIGKALIYVGTRMLMEDK